MGAILLVEDDPGDQILIKRAFAKANIANAIHITSDGEEAQRYLSGAPPFSDRSVHPLPVLMLLDLKLPKKSGLEVLAWLRDQPGLRRLPVVVLTSSRESPDVNRAHDLGVSSYLVKPVQFDGLIEMIRTLNLFMLLLSELPDVAPAA